MKIKLGDIVKGEYGRGKVVAMSKEWCIYELENGEEYVEEWDYIVIPSEPGDVGSVKTEHELGDD